MCFEFLHTFCGDWIFKTKTLCVCVCLLSSVCAPLGSDKTDVSVTAKNSRITKLIKTEC